MEIDDIFQDKKLKPFNQCPVCSGEIEEKTVEKLLRGGAHTAVLTVQVEVCLHCGERLYSPETVRRFEQIRRQLEQEDFSQLQPIGRSFQTI